MARATAVARAALTKDQLRRERYYNRRVRRSTTFQDGDSVWVFKPPKGKDITKLAYQWVGPANIIRDAGFDNFVVLRDDNDEHLMVHCSFLVSSKCPSNSLGDVADRIIAELAEEEGAEEHSDDNAGVENSIVGHANEGLSVGYRTVQYGDVHRYAAGGGVMAAERSEAAGSGQEVPSDGGSAGMLPRIAAEGTTDNDG
ncbi:RNA-dependent DNA polymerase [Phytophthora cinnamomi]|uniref:RNA-dependent DNA polymerase n=1 Tax=Phytophthora cinnamomi TaxID=4785 RepID=UPI00355A2933|nr:RNA-dependent DNA polymerase [Phytophthora cinnamomi]